MHAFYVQGIKKKMCECGKEGVDLYFQEITIYNLSFVCVVDHSIPVHCMYVCMYVRASVAVCVWACYFVAKSFCSIQVSLECYSSVFQCFVVL